MKSRCPQLSGKILPHLGILLEPGALGRLHSPASHTPSPQPQLMAQAAGMHTSHSSPRRHHPGFGCCRPEAGSQVGVHPDPAPPCGHLPGYPSHTMWWLWPREPVPTQGSLGEASPTPSFRSWVAPSRGVHPTLTLGPAWVGAGYPLTASPPQVIFQLRAKQCGVCGERARSAVLRPCQHRVLCEPCAASAPECPYCAGQPLPW